MIESIIKETNLDSYAEQEMEDLGELSLFDFSKVCSFSRLFYFVVYSLADGCNLFSSAGAHEGTPR